MWRKEEEFRDLLHKAAKKATKETLDAIANLALEEDKQGYKHVCALLVKEMKALKPQYRLRVFYALSAIVRLSVEKRGRSRDKYVERLTPLLDTIGRLLAEAPPEDQKQMLKVLTLWWHEEVFAAADITRLQHQLGGALAADVGGAALPPETASVSGAVPAPPGVAAAAAAAAAATGLAGTAESSGPIPGLHSPLSLPPESGAASADGSKSDTGAEGGGAATTASGGGPSGSQRSKRPRVEWGARVRQANSTLTGPAGASAQQLEAASTPAAASLPHSDSCHKLPPTPAPPLAPPEHQPEQPQEQQQKEQQEQQQQQPPSPPQQQQPQPPPQQPEEEEEYDPLAALDDSGAPAGVGAAVPAGGAVLPPLHPGLPPPPVHLPPLPQQLPPAPLQPPREPPQPQQRQQQQPAPWQRGYLPPPPVAASAEVEDIEMEEDPPAAQGRAAGEGAGPPQPVPPAPPSQGGAAQQADRKRRSRWEDGPPAPPAQGGRAPTPLAPSDGAVALQAPPLAVGGVSGGGVGGPEHGLQSTVSPDGAPPGEAGASGRARKSRWEG